MLRLATAAVFLVFVAAAARSSAVAAATEALPVPLLQLQAAALEDRRAYETLRSLAESVGPRFAGTDGDRKAIEWALATLRAQGFANVRAEPVTVPRWTRGAAGVQVLDGATPIEIAALALGGSVGTDGAPLEAEVIAATTLEELERLTTSQVQGKIVFLYDRMLETRDGMDYGPTVRIRSSGAIAAARLGAVALVIRSVGTEDEERTHTGSLRYADGVPRIPAFAIGNRSADQLLERLARGPVRLRVRSTARCEGTAQSANVIGEIPGRAAGTPREEYVVLGAHLDSWDVGVGAQDDAAGIAIVTEAARRIGELPVRPQRTLRVVLFANEEFGLSGARRYPYEHEATFDRHVAALEADLGAGRPIGFESRVAVADLPRALAVAELLKPLGVAFRSNDASGGSDLGPLRDRGLPVFHLAQDGSKYFEIHHTDADRLDRVDPRDLAFNVAAYATVAWALADGPGLAHLKRTWPKPQDGGHPCEWQP
jgi:carboxypeptidase Q